MKQHPQEPLIGITQAAIALGINRATLWRNVKAGKVASHDGKVRLSEARAGREANTQHNKARTNSGPKPKPKLEAIVPPRKRGRPSNADKAARALSQGKTPSVAKAAAPKPLGMATPPDPKSLAGAQTRERNTIAELREVELAEKRGRLIDKAVAEQAMFDAGREVRDAWLSWPSRVAEIMAAQLGVPSRDLLTVLNEHVHDHLAELSGDASRSRAA